MSIKPPYSLSPSKVSTFTDCALAFRFSAIDLLPEPPSAPATKGTLVHAALERLFTRPPGERDLPTALTCLEQAFVDLRTDPEYVLLELDDDARDRFVADAEQLVRKYFELEDPSTINPIGLELKLEASIARLRHQSTGSADAEGNLVVTDYKTGRPLGPHENAVRGRTYAYLCEQLFGARPAVCSCCTWPNPSPSSPPHRAVTRGLQRKVRRVDRGRTACSRDDFRPKPSKLCDWCVQAYCPAFGATGRRPRRRRVAAGRALAWRGRRRGTGHPRCFAPHRPGRTRFESDPDQRIAAGARRPNMPP
jgi:putative RecB family exonuclease